MISSGSEREFVQTRIDIADFHTTLYFLQGTSGVASNLGIDTPQAYESLYRAIAETKDAGYSYQEAISGNQGKVFDRLHSVYSKFWQKYLHYGDERTFTKYAWEGFIPIRVSLQPKLSFDPIFQPECKVSPVPKVILFPFGWSNWLSLLVNGKHSLSSLASMVTNIFNQPVFTFPGAKGPVKLQDWFDYVADGTCCDAFGGYDAVYHKQELLVTVTVLVRGTGFLSTGRLSTTSDLPALQDLVCSIPGLDSKRIRDQIYKIQGNLNFVVWDDYGCFIWFYKLMDTADKGNYRRLNCYHRNTFQALMLGWHQVKLLEEALFRIKGAPVSGLEGLLQGAVTTLMHPPYVSAGVHPLIKGAEVKAIATRAAQKFNLTI
ncbi:MAG: hypothetical protein NTZ34_05375 [Chloroflexi bacterium]|nr:hypothetical protein [Chloroflexota bacterium]